MMLMKEDIMVNDQVEYSNDVRMCIYLIMKHLARKLKTVYGVTYSYVLGGVE